MSMTPFQLGSVEAVRREGFVGFASVSVLRATALREVPKEQGVYLALWESAQAPVFLTRSNGGRFKGRDPTVLVSTLKERWVADNPIVYIGKAGGTNSDATLQKRLSQFLRFGIGAPIGHWGGRLIWQLADADSIVICWKTIPDREPRAVERELIESFRARYGARPFANLTG